MENQELICWLREWFERFIARFDRMDERLEKMLSGHNMLEGERLLDNEDICRFLNISKRTLQRYRSSGELPYQNIYHKLYYKESDVEAFIKTHFNKEGEPEVSSSGSTESGPENTDIP